MPAVPTDLDAMRAFTARRAKARAAARKAREERAAREAEELQRLGDDVQRQFGLGAGSTVFVCRRGRK